MPSIQHNTKNILLLQDENDETPKLETSKLIHQFLQKPFKTHDQVQNMYFPLMLEVEAEKLR